jgi:dinuclear metal center YbgI/SA1388 family protein
MKLGVLAEVIEKLAPKELKEEWDNVGILIGHQDKEIEKAVVSLDFNGEVLEYALKEGADLIITHHPVIFDKLSSITDVDLLNCIKNDISVYSAHTNLDSADGGVNDALCEALSLKNIGKNKMLRYGEISPMSVINFAEIVKEKLNTKSVRLTSREDKIVKKVGVLGGAGGDEITLAMESGCDLYLTGEAPYHIAQFAYKNDIALISAGHYETEILIVKKLAEYVENNTNVKVLPFYETNIYKQV